MRTNAVHIAHTIAQHIARKQKLHIKARQTAPADALKKKKQLENPLRNK